MVEPLTIVLYTLNSWESALPVLRVSGPAKAAGMRLIYGNKWEQVDENKVSQGDVVVIQRDFPCLAESYKKIQTLARSEEKPLIYDLDDLLLELPEGHPDRQSHFYAEALFPMVIALREADLVTTCTPKLAEYLRGYNSNVRLLPNCLNDALWPLRPASRSNVETNQPVVIGYMGGDSHLYDLEAFQVVWLDLLERYGERITLRFWGAQPPGGVAGRSNVEWIQFELLTYPEFSRYFLQQTCDIFIAPLADNRFNRYKSPIKFLEYSALGIPGVYSKLPAYESIVEHGENGFLASSPEEWLKQLADLIESPGLRQEMGRNARATVEQDWLLSQHAHRWREAYSEALGQVVARPREQSQSLPPGFQVAGQIHAFSTQQKSQITQQEQMIREMESELKELRTQVVEYRHHAQTLQEIYGSSAWQLVQWLRRARLILAPTGSPQERVVKAILRIFRSHRSSHAKGGSLPPGKAEIVIELPESVDKIHLKGQQPKGIDVLVFPVMEWESRVQRPQQIATQFARSGYRVFYLYPYFRGDGRTVVRHVSKNIFEVLLPASEPTNAYKDSMSEALENTCLGALESLRQEFGIGQAVSFVDLPFWTPLAFRLRRQFGWKVVYDCMDYHPGFASNSPEMLQQEDRLSRQCDLLLVTSQFLLKEKHGLNHNLVHVPNGADFDHFQPSVDVRPHELAGIAGPLIGYYGAIADWFDTDLIRSLAEAKPAWQFVLIGSTKYAHLDPIKDISNVHLFGEKPYADLPAYLHAFDVAIIPFKPMPLTQATNPVKLFEYLSAGKAIVATDLEELRHYTDLVRLASSVEGWLLAIEEALGDYAPQRVQERIDYARGNTWKDRFDQIEKEISRLLQE